MNPLLLIVSFFTWIGAVMLIFMGFVSVRVAMHVFGYCPWSILEEKEKAEPAGEVLRGRRMKG